MMFRKKPKKLSKLDRLEMLSDYEIEHMKKRIILEGVSRILLGIIILCACVVFLFNGGGSYW